MHSFELLTALLLSLSSVSCAVTFSPPPIGWTASSSFQITGVSGVAAMQMAVVSDSKIIFIDKTENNPLTASGRPVWAAEMDIATSNLRALKMITNSFCAGGSWLKNGTLLSLAGAADSALGNQNGLQAVRFFTPCENGQCTILEYPTTVRLDRARWYPATIRLQDGSVFIMGGVSETIYMTPENSIEFWPKKGAVRNSPFLKAALKDNLFPHAHLLPDGRIFVAANNKAMIYNWQTDTEQDLPNLPNNLRVTYPYGSSSALLPLKSTNNYQAEVLFCGGTNLPPATAVRKTTPAANRCYRMLLSAAGISAGWKNEEAPDGRIMSNLVIMPDGNLVFINGAGTGFAGYYNNRQADGSFSSADMPQKTPYLYQPDLPSGRRWSQLGTTAQVNRMYHSVASLLPDGRVITSGSNPVPRVEQSPSNPYSTEYRNEYLTPPYMSSLRPVFTGLPATIRYGATFTLNLVIPVGLTGPIKVMLHDLGFSTHAVDYSRRAVYLNFVRDGDTLTVTNVPHNRIYPPGPAWLYVTVQGVPAIGKKTLVA